MGIQIDVVASYPIKQEMERVLGLADNSREGTTGHLSYVRRLHARPRSHPVPQRDRGDLHRPGRGTAPESRHLKLEAERLDSRGGTAVWAAPILLH